MRRTQVGLLVLLFLILSPIIGGIIAAGGQNWALIVSGLVLVGILIATVAIARYRTEPSNEGDEGSWSFIPDWQYEGRFAEAGGLTVSEQSKEIEKIQEKAEEREG